MKGVILAGGKGTRLMPLTLVANKHLLPVYDKPMIFYPIRVLKVMGVTDIVLVSGGENIGGFVGLLGDGRELGVKITYRVQREAGGIAQALAEAEGLVDIVDGLFPVILGDNYFGSAPKMPDRPTIFTKHVANANRFGVLHDGVITEKPDIDTAGYAVTGLYVYDDRVFDMIRALKPSARGELEITDVNNQYLKLGAGVQEIFGRWSDMGTFDSLLEVSNWEAAWRAEYGHSVRQG